MNEFLNQNIQKNPAKWTRNHVIDLEGWSREETLLLLEQAKHMEAVMSRTIKKVPALRGKLAVNLFFENSTRTRVSFELAEKMLSADVVNWSASGSSASKGETLRDTAWTLEVMGADIVVIRHSAVGAAEYLSKKLKHAVVMNAGDGAHAHPTQGLLDIYTAWKHLGNLDGKKIAILGDVEHSRVARTDAHGFRNMGCEVVFSGPGTMMPAEVKHLGVTYEHDAQRAVAGADMIYLLRVQRERQHGVLLPSENEYHRYWGATEAMLDKVGRHVLVMHPGPINRGVEIASEVADGPQSVILEQVRSGVAVRMALLYLCAGGAMSE